MGGMVGTLLTEEDRRGKKKGGVKNILQGCHYRNNSHTKEQKETFEWVGG